MGRNHFNESRRWEEKRRSTRRVEEESTRMMIEERRAIETRRPYRTDRRLPERDRVAKRRNLLDAGLTEYAPQTKRRRGGEVVLSNILESIVDQLRDNIEISYLFLKPVTKKEAPDYLDIIKNPMDLSTIRDKVRNMEYRSKEDFRHDVWQIAYNAHKYNDRRNPGIPPLADQLLELCDYLLIQKDEILTEAEAGIEPGQSRDGFDEPGGFGIGFLQSGGAEAARSGAQPCGSVMLLVHGNLDLEKAVQHLRNKRNRHLNMDEYFFLKREDFRCSLWKLSVGCLSLKG
ncbi:hypothetical protein HPP92_016598 [Vanilla planifolia]|uniref:Bromo domain-containing protein n=1 Tax=Vanilla planifolia TaxID=51239 RepID=A0A835QNH2_VANPL|nr:hypothetical protein HPP92_016598 [Vanilla planifolia]